MEEFVGRKRECEVFDNYFNSRKSEFVAVYGRRRVGKTFLIRSVFKDRMTFEFTGMANATLEQQLLNFKQTLKSSFNLPYEPEWIIG
jgi:AAA+ ATPase superfamily predicted ATPase